MLERFADKIECGPEIDSCWEWIGAKNDKGYGSFWLGNINIKSHRFSYELYKGKIPEGLQIDHLCRNKSCCNPDHLEAVTARINTLRGNNMASLNSRKTHCPKGHEYNKKNTYLRKTGGRTCRECDRIRSKKGIR